MSGLGPITIRICPGNNAATDWSGVIPEQVTFAGCMDVISQVLPGVTVTAFEYDDEDNDRITVRSDEELKLMMFSYVSSLVESTRGPVQPLHIYPKIGKKPDNRNIHGLKIQTKPVDGAAVSPMAVDEPIDQESSSHMSQSVVRFGMFGHQKSMERKLEVGTGG